MVRLTQYGKPIGKAIEEAKAIELLEQLKWCVLGIGMKKVRG